MATFDKVRFHVYIVGMAALLGTLEQIVLLGVRSLDDQAYGRAVLHSVQSAIAGRTVSAGSVYATLDRLEAQGLLASRFEEGGLARGGRIRRFYRLTLPGTSALTETRTTLEKMWHAGPLPSEVVK